MCRLVYFDPTQPGDWSQNRVLSSRFLQTILFKDPYRGKLTRKGVVISGARFTEAIDLNYAELEHPFGLRYSLLEKDVNLEGIRSKFPIDFEGSNVAGTFDMRELELGGDLTLDYGHFQWVLLTGAHVGGQLDLSASRLTNKLDMRGVRVDGDLFMHRNAEFTDVDLSSAHVGGQLDLSGWGGPDVGSQISRDSKVAGDVICYGLDVEQQVVMGAEFEGRFDCRTAKIKGDLYLNGQFNQDVDLSGTQIDGSLHLEWAQWADGVTLVLRDAKVLGTIPALTDPWAPKLDLDGFTYRSVGEADQFKDWFGRLPSYAPQPYDQLSSTVQSQGNGALATAIRYSSRDRERSEAKDRAWVWLTILKWVIGYGYYPYLAVFWAIALVIMGALVLRVSGEGPRNGMPYGFAYSIDTLLPIIRLREKHSKIDLQSWPRYYFYGHKIMGYVLGFFLIAGITGLTK